MIPKRISLFLPLSIYAALFLPFLGVLPYLDGNIDFVKSHDFYAGGVNALINNWTSVHPPLKQILSSAFFNVLGVNQFSYNLMGLVFGLLGIVFVYLLSKRLTNNASALLVSFLLAIHPLYISVGIFSLTDFLLCVAVLGGLYFYSRENYLFFSLLACLAFLSKETGILLAIAALAVEVVFGLRGLFGQQRSRGLGLPSWIAVYFPFLVFFLWGNFLKARGGAFWQDWNFSEVGEKGSVYTVLHNITTLGFLNKYAYQNWKELLILNFNWIYTTAGLFGTALLLNHKSFRALRNFIKQKNIEKTVYVIILFCVFYFFTALTFQTYTIPRYGLPLGPFLLMGASFTLMSLVRKHKIFATACLALVVAISVLRLFISVDPISTKIWGKEKILGQEVWAIRKSLAGNDGMTYNLQYLQIAKTRSDKILGEEKILMADCYWLFPDPNNERKTIKILSVDKTYLNSCKI